MKTTNKQTANANVKSNVLTAKKQSERVINQKALVTFLKEEYISLSALIKDMNEQLQHPTFIQFLLSSGLKAERINVQTLLHNLPYTTIDGKRVLCKVMKLSDKQIADGVKIKDVAAYCDKDATYKFEICKDAIQCTKDNFQPVRAIGKGDEKVTYFLRPINSWNFNTILNALLKIQTAENKAEKETVAQREEPNKPNGTATAKSVNVGKIANQGRKKERIITPSKKAIDKALNDQKAA